MYLPSISKLAVREASHKGMSLTLIVRQSLRISDSHNQRQLRIYLAQGGNRTSNFCLLSPRQLMIVPRFQSSATSKSFNLQSSAASLLDAR